MQTEAKLSGNTEAVTRQEVICTEDGSATANVSTTNFEGTSVFWASSRQQREARFSHLRETPALTMYFSLDGMSAAKPRNEPARLLRSHHHTVVYTPRFEGFYFSQSPRLINFGIELSAAFYNRLLDIDLDTVQRFRERIQRGEQAELSAHPMPVTPAQLAVIREMQQCMYDGGMKRMYYESKILELFLMQVAQAERQGGGLPVTIKPYDIDKLHAARHFIQENMLSSFTLEQVSRAAGLNEFKLKKGFRELFGTTVFGYLNELRMHHARELLLGKGTAVQEVADILGYAEPHSFTKVFKKFFGYLPRELK